MHQKKTLFFQLKKTKHKTTTHSTPLYLDTNVIFFHLNIK